MLFSMLENVLKKQLCCFMMSDFRWSHFPDVDECVSMTHTCDANATCNNTFGSFTCKCLDGFVGSGQKGTCKGKCVGCLL